MSEVIDGWYDSGAMPFAQWGYPHTGRDDFAEQFPADFISEAIDQTRGWFYSQLAISTLLFGDEQLRDPLRPFTAWPHPFRNCVVLGLMLGEDGQKMSKSKRNYREPQEIFDRYGADGRCVGISLRTSRPGLRFATTSQPSATAFPSSCYVCGTCTAFS